MPPQESLLLALPRTPSAIQTGRGASSGVPPPCAATPSAIQTGRGAALGVPPRAATYAIQAGRGAALGVPPRAATYAISHPGRPWCLPRSPSSSRCHAVSHPSRPWCRPRSPSSRCHIRHQSAIPSSPDTVTPTASHWCRPWRCLPCRLLLQSSRACTRPLISLKGTRCTCWPQPLPPRRQPRKQECHSQATLHSFPSPGCTPLLRPEGRPSSSIGP